MRSLTQLEETNNGLPALG